MMEVIVPRENVNDSSVTISAVHCLSGDSIIKGNVVVSIETSKTNLDIEAEVDGVVNHNLIVGQEVAVGALLFTIGAKKIEKIIKKNEETSKNFAARKIYSNAALKRAEELRVNIEHLPGGWYAVADVERLAGIVTNNNISIKKLFEFFN